MEVYEQVTPQELEREQRAEDTERKEASGESWQITVFQAAVCAALLVAALLLKTLLPAAFAQVKERYTEEMSRSLVITEDDVSHP